MNWKYVKLVTNNYRWYGILFLFLILNQEKYKKKLLCKDSYILKIILLLFLRKIL